MYKNKKLSIKIKQSNKDAKALSGVIMLIIYLAIITKLFTPVALADYTERYGKFPQAKDNLELSVPMQIRVIAKDNNASEYADYLIELAYCESRFDRTATNLNKGHSLDVGLFQWNMYYHPEVGIDCALDVECATIKTIEALKEGKSSMWVCSKYIGQYKS